MPKLRLHFPKLSYLNMHRIPVIYFPMFSLHGVLHFPLRFVLSPFSATRTCRHKVGGRTQPQFLGLHKLYSRIHPNDNSSPFSEAASLTTLKTSPCSQTLNWSRSIASVFPPYVTYPCSPRTISQVPRCSD